MRDFPIFDTEFGLSSLTLKEIPYKKAAYIRILSIVEGRFGEHLKECVAFCRMAGAERIFLTGSEECQTFPLYNVIWEMRGTANGDDPVCLFPVTEETAEGWRRIYNEKMRPVPNAATLESRDLKKLLTGGAYFVHEAGQLLGIGWVEDDALLAMAAVKPGAGRKILATLMTLVEGEMMTLEVASTNGRATRLYESMGFVKTKEVVRWYEVPVTYGL